MGSIEPSMFAGHSMLCPYEGERRTFCTDRIVCATRLQIPRSRFSLGTRILIGF